MIQEKKCGDSQINIVPNIFWKGLQVVVGDAHGASREVVIIWNLNEVTPSKFTTTQSCLKTKFQIKASSSFIKYCLWTQHL